MTQTVFAETYDIGNQAAVGVRQKVGSVSSDRIKILTGVGTNMLPRIKNQDIVFVDVEHRWIGR